MTPQPQEGWEREFEKFTERLTNADTGEQFLSTKYNSHYLVKNFIRSLLAERDREIVEKLEKLKQTLETDMVGYLESAFTDPEMIRRNDRRDGYNQALTDAIEAIKEGK